MSKQKVRTFDNTQVSVNAYDRADRNSDGLTGL